MLLHAKKPVWKDYILHNLNYMTLWNNKNN